MLETESKPVTCYKAPPITEAVVEMHFGDVLSESARKRTSGKVARFYPTEVQEGLINLQLNPAARKAEFIDEDKWLKRATEDQTEILLIKSNVLTWSQLAPYATWDQFSERIRRDIDVIAVRPRRIVTRIGMRYINRIDIPASGDSVGQYEGYLQGGISMPPIIPPPSAYTWHYETRHEDVPCRSVIKSATVIPIVPNTNAIMLDIDLIADVVPARFEEMWELLQQLRHLKNTLFESIITDKAREIFSS